jgi:hypothetical protein
VIMQPVLRNSYWKNVKIYQGVTLELSVSKDMKNEKKDIQR